VEGLVKVFGIYLFIFIGFLAKNIFKEIEAKTLVLLSTYFLQPFLTLWGIMLIPLNYNLIMSPVVYLISVFTALIFTFVISLKLSGKERIIATLTPLIVNGGNIGIPLCYALFGEIGASIATLVNLANIFFIYSFGIFFFAKGEYSFKESFFKIIKIPIIWVAIIALLLNIKDVKFSKEIMDILKMGAFASIVIQLITFGIYISEIKLKEMDLKLDLIVVINKFVVFPLVGFIVLKLFHLNGVYFKAVFLEISTPLAITNVNLAALFNLYPQKVAYLIFLTTVLFFIGSFIFLL